MTRWSHWHWLRLRVCHAVPRPLSNKGAPEERIHHLQALAHVQGVVFVFVELAEQCKHLLLVRQAQPMLPEASCDEVADFAIVPCQPPISVRVTLAICPHGSFQVLAAFEELDHPTTVGTVCIDDGCEHVRMVQEIDDNTTGIGHRLPGHGNSHVCSCPVLSGED